MSQDTHQRQVLIRTPRQEARPDPCARAGDALRPFLLHAYGGMYLDLDVQCFTSSEAWLAPYTLVLQSEYGDGRDIVNSVMASVPGHPFWKAIIGQMMQVGLGCQNIITNISHHI